MSNIFFSIIIPTYNEANFLKKALDSILKQSFKNYEIIVIDNYSKDNTAKIISNFKNKKIKYFKKKNFGVIAKSRNLGIKKAKGKWIALLDSDDSWFPQRLEIIKKFITKQINHKVFCTAEIILNENNKTHLWRYGPSKNNFYQYLLENGNCLSTSASIIEKNFLIKNKIFYEEKKSFITSEDYDFFLNIANKTNKFYFINKPLGTHVFHSRSESSNFRKHRNSLYSVLRHHIFKKQKYNKDKEDIWEKVNLRINIKDCLIKLINKKNKLGNFVILLKYFQRMPINSLSIIVVLLLKSLVNRVFFYYYIISKN